MTPADELEHRVDQLLEDLGLDREGVGPHGVEAVRHRLIALDGEEIAAAVRAGRPTDRNTQ